MFIVAIGCDLNHDQQGRDSQMTGFVAVRVLWEKSGKQNLQNLRGRIFEICKVFAKFAKFAKH